METGPTPRAAPSWGQGDRGREGPRRPGGLGPWGGATHGADEAQQPGPREGPVGDGRSCRGERGGLRGAGGCQAVARRRPPHPPMDPWGRVWLWGRPSPASAEGRRPPRAAPHAGESPPLRAQTLAQCVGAHGTPTAAVHRALASTPSWLRAPDRERPRREAAPTLGARGTHRPSQAPTWKTFLVTPSSP